MLATLDQDEHELLADLRSRQGDDRSLLAD
jgi:hypothetical protein